MSRLLPLQTVPPCSSHGVLINFTCLCFPPYRGQDELRNFTDLCQINTRAENSVALLACLVATLVLIRLLLVIFMKLPTPGHESYPFCQGRCRISLSCYCCWNKSSRHRQPAVEELVPTASSIDENEYDFQYCRNLHRSLWLHTGFVTATILRIGLYLNGDLHADRRLWPQFSLWLASLFWVASTATGPALWFDLLCMVCHGSTHAHLRGGDDGDNQDASSFAFSSVSRVNRPNINTRGQKTSSVMEVDVIYSPSNALMSSSAASVAPPLPSPLPENANASSYGRVALVRDGDDKGGMTHNNEQRADLRGGGRRRDNSHDTSLDEDSQDGGTIENLKDDEMSVRGKSMRSDEASSVRGKSMRSEEPSVRGKSMRNEGGKSMRSEEGSMKRKSMRNSGKSKRNSGGQDHASNYSSLHGSVVAAAPSITPPPPTGPGKTIRSGSLSSISRQSSSIDNRSFSDGIPGLYHRFNWLMVATISVTMLAANLVPVILDWLAVGTNSTSGAMNDEARDRVYIILSQLFATLIVAFSTFTLLMIVVIAYKIKQLVKLILIYAMQQQQRRDSVHYFSKFSTHITRSAALQALSLLIVLTLVLLPVLPAPASKMGSHISLLYLCISLVAIGSTVLTTFGYVGGRWSPNSVGDFSHLDGYTDYDNYDYGDDGNNNNNNNNDNNGGGGSGPNQSRHGLSLTATRHTGKQPGAGDWVDEDDFERGGIAIVRSGSINQQNSNSSNSNNNINTNNNNSHPSYHSLQSPGVLGSSQHTAQSVHTYTHLRSPSPNHNPSISSPPSSSLPPKQRELSNKGKVTQRG